MSDVVAPVDGSPSDGEGLEASASAPVVDEALARELVERQYYPNYQPESQIGEY